MLPPFGTTHKTSIILPAQPRQLTQQPIFSQDPFIYIQSNLHATTRLLEYARTAGCDSFVYASSSSVYGEVRLARESSSKKINYFEFGVQLNNPQHDPDAIPSARMNPPNGSTRWTHSVRQ